MSIRGLVIISFNMLMNDTAKAVYGWLREHYSNYNVISGDWVSDSSNTRTVFIGTSRVECFKHDSGHLMFQFSIDFADPLFFERVLGFLGVSKAEI